MLKTAEVTSMPSLVPIWPLRNSLEGKKLITDNDRHMYVLMKIFHMTLGSGEIKTIIAYI
jgi:hypothetical protein